jgi:hypothetical protein
MWLDRFRSSPATRQIEEPPNAPAPRATRFKLDSPVSFSGDEGTYDGHCINVSESGLLARFNKLPEVWTNGKLTLEAGEHYLTIPARVARHQGQEVGFAFALDSENDRDAVAILIRSVQPTP